MKKASSDLVQDRLQYVLSLVVNGLSMYQVIKQCRKQEKIDFDITDKVIRLYYHKAKAMIKKTATKDIEYYLSRTIKRYDDLYARSVMNQDFRTAAGINDKLLEAIGAKKNININENRTQIEFHIPETEEEYNKAISKIINNDTQ